MSQAQPAFEEPVVLSDEESVEDVDRDVDQQKAMQPAQRRNLQRPRKILSEDFYRTMEENQRTSGLVETASQLARDPLPQSNLEETLRLRLDINLDLEVRLRAHLHGDLTLALLYLSS